MKKLALSLFVISALFQSCSNDDDGGSNPNNVVAPATYEFTRNGSSTVSYGGQTTRIAMAEELVAGFKKDAGKSEQELMAMFAHVESENDFSDADLNASDKSIRSKTAASTDYFSANTTDANAIKADFDGYIESQVAEVFVKWDDQATEGNAGFIQQTSGTIRYVNAKGLEYNQAFAKGLIGALMIDQILNNYLSPAVLNAGSNVANNDNEELEDGKDYTTMEHKWDEAFGYLYGAEADASAPTLSADPFLNKYTLSVDSDEDFSGIADNIYNAFKLGRAAIVAKNYEVRDEQAEIIKENISLIPAVRAVYYLQAAKGSLDTDKSSAFHSLSEAYGFIYSLQFTRVPNTDGPYFTKTEVEAMLDTLMENDGFWDITDETLDDMSATIAAKFNFTVAQAAPAN
ncbi:DUF4856 domain-containing protein [Tamlana crocina]|uniref:DUF4856 domain-containing protein n=1 Tax=Tamlana crocina TaxID=393006 RepID=A0ABX1DDY7_9FLAO|nr:DUF4856 domain-containing protein [Tamlana crocina]NJX16562.1 DUF4856 domain-containing protein [Tamlana crocina]